VSWTKEDALQKRHAAVVIALGLATGWAAAQEAPTAGDVWEVKSHLRLTPGRDSYFAANHYTSMALLHLRADGTFAQYDREHLFIAQGDEGRWRQTDAGEVQLCSHFHFRPIAAGELRVYPREDDAHGLPALLTAIEAQLSASPARQEFEPKALMPVVVRSLLSDDAFGPVSPNGIAPIVMCEEKRVSRKDLEGLAAALREYIAARSGNLTSSGATGISPGCRSPDRRLGRGQSSGGCSRRIVSTRKERFSPGC
jgi:hypothetical protein